MALYQTLDIHQSIIQWSGIGPVMYYTLLTDSHYLQDHPERHLKNGYGYS